MPPIWREKHFDLIFSPSPTTNFNYTQTDRVATLHRFCTSSSVTRLSWHSKTSTSTWNYRKSERRKKKWKVSLEASRVGKEGNYKFYLLRIGRVRKRAKQPKNANFNQHKTLTYNAILEYLHFISFLLFLQALKRVGFRVVFWKTKNSYRSILRLVFLYFLLCAAHAKLISTLDLIFFVFRSTLWRSKSWRHRWHVIELRRNVPSSKRHGMPFRCFGRKYRKYI